MKTSVTVAPRPIDGKAFRVPKSRGVSGPPDPPVSICRSNSSSGGTVVVVKMKECNSCLIEKPESNFKKIRQKNDGSGEYYYTKDCNECRKISGARRLVKKHDGAFGPNGGDGSVSCPSERPSDYPSGPSGISDYDSVCSSTMVARAPIGTPIGPSEMSEMRRMQFAERMMDFIDRK